MNDSPRSAPSPAQRPPRPPRPLRLRRRIRRRLHSVLRQLALIALRPLRLRPVPRPGGRLRVRILLQHAHGTGGTIRTVLNLCGYLARDHDVELVSLVKRRETSFFPLPSGVRVTYVDDDAHPPRGRITGLPARLPSILVPVHEASFRYVSLWTDLRFLRLMLRRPPDVLIGTRPSLNMLVAELAPRGLATIGQDHMSLESYQPVMRDQVLRSYRRLTVVTVLTEAARAGYERGLAGSGVRIVRIPNAAPPLPDRPSPREDKVVLAAGRLVYTKGFDLLLRAFVPVAAEHPDWTLRIFGGGARRAKLEKMIADLGLTGRAELRPSTGDLPGQMARASIFALSSRREGMGMVMIEAMWMGLPVVAFDCPFGPAELITHGRDGLLVTPGDVDAMSAALRTLIADPRLRDRLGTEARRSARAYRMEELGPRWTRLIAATVHGRP